jgi:hypothetical protein
MYARDIDTMVKEKLFCFKLCQKRIIKSLDENLYPAQLEDVKLDHSEVVIS